MSSSDEFLVVADAAEWRAWLDTNEDTSDGVWLVLAKKGTVAPTSLMQADALMEALCSGWIDGQRKSHDDATFLQRYTPRRARSIWSQRNVEYVGQLIDQGRMRPRGHREIERARADGRWERAYPGSATAQVPDDLIAALADVPGGRERFDALKAQDRYALLLRLMTAPNDTVREKRLTKVVEMLRDGEAHPRNGP